MKKQKNYQEYVNELGKRIKAYRIMKGLSQQDIAEMTGVSMRSLSRLEQGEAGQVENLFKVLMALDLDENIELLVPDQSKRPSYYLKNEEDRPKRVRKKKEKTDFKWGDEV